MVEWIDLDELLDKSIGDIREMLAHEDSDSSFRTFLIENGWIEDIVIILVVNVFYPTIFY